MPLAPVPVPPPVFRMPTPPPLPNWVPSLTGTLRPTLVLFCPPSSTCIWVLLSSFELPFDCKRLRLVGGKPSRNPAPNPPVPKPSARAPILVAVGRRLLLPNPPRFVSEVVGVVLKT